MCDSPSRATVVCPFLRSVPLQLTCDRSPPDVLYILWGVRGAILGVQKGFGRIAADVGRALLEVAVGTLDAKAGLRFGAWRADRLVDRVDSVKTMDAIEHGGERLCLDVDDVSRSDSLAHQVLGVSEDVCFEAVRVWHRGEQVATDTCVGQDCLVDPRPGVVSDATDGENSRVACPGRQVVLERVEEAQRAEGVDAWSVTAFEADKLDLVVFGIERQWRDLPRGGWAGLVGSRRFVVAQNLGSGRSYGINGRPQLECLRPGCVCEVSR